MTSYKSILKPEFLLLISVILVQGNTQGQSETLEISVRGQAPGEEGELSETLETDDTYKFVILDFEGLKGDSRGPARLLEDKLRKNLDKDLGDDVEVEVSGGGRAHTRRLYNNCTNCDFVYLKEISSRVGIRLKVKVVVEVARATRKRLGKGAHRNLDFVSSCTMHYVDEERREICMENTIIPDFVDFIRADVNIRHRTKEIASDRVSTP